MKPLPPPEWDEVLAKLGAMQDEAMRRLMMKGAPDAEYQRGVLQAINDVRRLAPVPATDDGGEVDPILDLYAG